MKTTGINRFEVIDENGRTYARRSVRIELSVQDGGQTLKVFVAAADVGTGHITPTVIGSTPAEGREPQAK